MPKIFVSYRRMDSEERAHRIADWLVNKYGLENVFIDVDRISGGADFIKSIEDSLAQTDVLLVIIGDKWVDELARRSTLPEVDFVRLEVRTGLEKIPLVIPVLMNQNIDIRANQLPDDLRPMMRHNFRFIRRGGDFHRDLELIREEIDEQFPPEPGSQPELEPPSRSIPFIPILIILGMIGVIILFAVLTTQGNGGGTAIVPITVDSAITPTDEPVIIVKTDTDEPTIEPTDTDEPTIEPTNTNEPTATHTLSPTPTETPDVAVIAQTLVAQQTAQQIIDHATAMSEQKTLEAQLTLTQQANETATAIEWTKTPTPDFTASVEALLTVWADGTLTQQALDSTATATLWTATPTTHNILRLTPTTHSVLRPTHTPTLSPEELAKIPVISNADWTPIERDFDGVTMVLVPVGCFMMGSADGDSDEQPVHEQCFDEPFWIDKYEVTQANFARLGGRNEGGSFYPGGNKPEEFLTWFEAWDFCESRGGRLPTEKEWEYVARGPDNLIYPWGNDWKNNAVYKGNSSQPAEVGSLPEGISWVGAMDMSGNIWEWVSSLYTDSYPYSDTQEDQSDTINYRVLRGGSFVIALNYLQSANRGRGNPTSNFSPNGFRCARS